MKAVSIVRRLIDVTKELRTASEVEEFHRLAPLLAIRQELMNEMDAGESVITEELLELLEILKVEDDLATQIMQRQKRMLMTEHLHRMGRERQLRQSYIPSHTTRSRFEAFQ